MRAAWPNADFPRTPGGAADLFGAEAVADYDALREFDAPVIPGATYTPPAGDAANFSWVGVAAYTVPDGDAADFSWVPGEAPEAEGTATATVATLALTGAATGAVGTSCSIAGTLPAFEISGEATGSAGRVDAEVSGEVAQLSLGGEASAAMGAAGSAAATVAFLDLTGLVRARLITQGAISATVAAMSLAATITAQHPRYELRGQVRLAGNPVERRVRAYRRDTGALLGQGDTTGGFFRIPAGFAEIECTVLPIDLSPGATDYEPPTANRVLCVLAEDEA